MADDHVRTCKDDRGEARAINDICKGIADRPDYMARIKQLGGSNTYQYFSFEEINNITAAADKQIKEIFDSFAS